MLGLKHQLDAIEQQVSRIRGGIADMTNELDAANQAAAAVEADVANIQNAVAGLKGQIADLQALVADLQGQIGAGTGIDPAQVQALADRLNAVDQQLDTIAPDPAPPTEEPTADSPPADAGDGSEPA